MRHLLALPLPLLLLAAAPATDERKFLISGFDRLRVEGPYTVEVVPGTTATATATGDPKALAQLSLRSDGGTLTVSTGSQGWETRQGQQFTSPRIRIVTPALRAIFINGGGTVTAPALRGQRIDLTLNGSGTIDARGITANDVNVTLIGSGTVTLAGKTNTARFRSTGAGAIAGAGLTTSQGVIVAESAGTTQLNALLSVQVNAMGAGTIAITGPAECRIRGGGPVSCQGQVKR